MEAITSYSTADDSSSSSSTSSVVNEVVREYNDLGMLVKEYQEHAGEVDGNSPFVEYNYDDSADLSGELTKGMRLQSIGYPDGRLVHFTYGTSGSAADNLNRLDAIKADSSGSPGTTLASYTYLGSGLVVEIDYEEPALREERLDLIGSGHAYSGFDRFLRIVDQRWHNYGASGPFKE